MRYVIIGAGIAGTTAAEELRKLDPSAEVVLLSEELHRVYSRVLLPHYVKGKVEREKCFLKKEDWYAAQNIEWLPGVVAESIDTTNKFVMGSDGREYDYDKLLITTGGEVKTIEVSDRQVSYFRTLDDADHLLQLLGELLPSPRGDKEGWEAPHADIIGGGFIALEYINMFADRQISADVHLRGARFFRSVLDVDSSELIRAKAESDGITVHQNSVKESFDGLVGVGIGIAPDLSLVRQAGIEVNDGIKTNEYLETNLADVYAAGDVAEYFDLIAGRQRMSGNWMNAQMQGRAVAKVMTGNRTAFRLVSSYATNCRGLEVIFIGDTGREAAEEIRVIGSIAEGGVAQHFLRGGKLVGATLVGRNADRAKLTKAINDQTPYVDFS